MIQKTGYRTYEEAVKEAEALLWANRSSEGQLATTKHTRKDDKGDRLPFAYIEDKETGATAYIYSIFPEDGYDVTFLSGEEAAESNRTYPFRDTSKHKITFLMAINTPVFKPTKAITPDEALTPEGQRTIFSFFGDNTGKMEGYGFMSKEETEAKEYTVETAFENWDEEDVGSLLCTPFPKALQELTGVKVKTPSDYAQGIAKLLKAELTEEQAEQAKSTFLFFASDALLRYAIYEFFRTEDYAHLKRVLSSYRKFYLSDKWDEELALFGFTSSGAKAALTAEEYVIVKYLSRWNADITGEPSRLKEIAAYTGIPLSLMGKVYKIERIFYF